mmetsp:Transcript_24856/g.71559  ORF Transcript_24856/g.71559 Transcript_24856/m.71559 type:complete len:211 (-) Transcript_24856:801-1433(-)
MHGPPCTGLQLDLLPAEQLVLDHGLEFCHRDPRIAVRIRLSDDLVNVSVRQVLAKTLQHALHLGGIDAAVAVGVKPPENVGQGFLGDGLLAHVPLAVGPAAHLLRERLHLRVRVPEASEDLAAKGQGEEHGVRRGRRDHGVQAQGPDQVLLVVIIRCLHEHRQVWVAPGDGARDSVGLALVAHGDHDKPRVSDPEVVEDLPACAVGQEDG